MPRFRCLALLLLLGACAASGELEMTEEPDRDGILVGGETDAWRYRPYRAQDDAGLLPYLRYSRPF